MEGTWNVYFEDKIAGTCRVWREGLYCCVSCRCAKVAEGICRLMLQCGDAVTDLGILVPVGSGFGLEKRIAAKNLSDGEPRFYIQSAEKKQEGIFIPVRAGEPFDYLSRLEEVCFARRDGEVGVIIR